MTDAERGRNVVVWTVLGKRRESVILSSLREVVTVVVPAPRL